MDDNRVINLAWLLQSLDADGDPSGGISITESVVKAFETVINDKELADVDFSNDSEVESVIEATVAEGSGYADLNLVKVSREEAQGHLGKSIGSTMFRKNVSKTPLMASAKAKLNVMGVWFPALKANGEPAAYLDSDGNTVTGIPYYDENGDLIRTATEAKPVVAVYTDEIDGYGAADVFAAVSRDDGHTWKRKNISRMADRSSFTLANGEAYYGHCKKPVFQVKGNKILIAWTSKFAKGGKPRYAIRSCPDEDGDGVADECETCTGSGENEKCGPDYPYDDPYEVDDIWGVSGPQRSVDYTEQGYPEVGEVPYSAIWTCRGVIVTQAEINKGGWWADRQVGDIVWYKPERMTSGRRDANQVFMGAADGAGFAITWQEDPKGLRPGEAKGPGPGWGGATANHKTDIWYSYITWKDHATVDENFVAGGDPEHPVQYDEETGEEIAWTNRPKALVPMSLPVRISDNDSVNTNNTTLLDADGNPIAAVSAGAIVYNAANLTRCVKFVGGATIVTPDDPAASTADYAVLRAVPSTHQATMNCTQCHVPFGMTSVNDAPTQGAPIPLVVLDAETDSYLGGFTNSDCVSCHYGHVVPRDRVIAVTPGLTDEGKCDECEAKGGIWKDGTQEGGEIIELITPTPLIPTSRPIRTIPGTAPTAISPRFRVCGPMRTRSPRIGSGSTPRPITRARNARWRLLPTAACWTATLRLPVPTSSCRPIPSQTVPRVPGRSWPTKRPRAWDQGLPKRPEPESSPRTAAGMILMKRYPMKARTPSTTASILPNRIWSAVAPFSTYRKRMTTEIQSMSRNRNI